MPNTRRGFGERNPDAPAALSRFAFLIGEWRCEANLKVAEGKSRILRANWVGRFVLDGYAVADEFRMVDSAGKLMVLGVNIRAYDTHGKHWNMKWLNALAGTWTDLVTEELGGVRFDDRSISYVFKEPVADHAYTRATYTVVSENRFVWKGEKSDDGSTWDEFMTIEANRCDN